MLIICDGVGMAYMGASLYSLPISWCIFLSCWIDLGNPMVSPGGDPFVWGFQVPPGEAESYLCVVALWFLHPVVQ